MPQAQQGADGQWYAEIGGKRKVYDPTTGRMQDAANPNDPMQQNAWAIQSGQNYATQLGGLQNPFAGITDADSAAKKFGLRRDVSSLFSPVRSALKTQFGQNRGRALSSAATRMGSGTAIPEATFSGLEGELAGAENAAMTDLAQSETTAQLGQEDRIAQILYGAMGQGGQFDLNKLTAAMGGQFQAGNAQQSRRLAQEELAGPSAFDWFSTILGAGADAAKGALAPASATTNYY